MRERLRFWTEQEKWPADAFGNVFLARAVLKVGAAAFGDEWTGKEPTTPEPVRYSEVIPGKVGPDGYQLRGWRGGPWSKSAREIATMNLWMALIRYMPEAGEIGFENWKTQPEDAPTWQLAFLAVERQDHERHISALKLKAVHDCIRDGLREGHLVAMLRAFEGGDFIGPIQRALWNSERVDNRFAFCAMNPAEPFGTGVIGKGYRYIFITDQSLQKFIGHAEHRSTDKNSPGAKPRQPTSTVGAAIQEAARALYPPNGAPPIGMTKTAYYSAIKAKCRGMTNTSPDDKTLRKHLKGMGAIPSR